MLNTQFFFDKYPLINLKLKKKPTIVFHHLDIVKNIQYYYFISIMCFTQQGR